MRKKSRLNMKHLQTRYNSNTKAEDTYLTDINLTPKQRQQYEQKHEYLESFIAERWKLEYLATTNTLYNFTEMDTDQTYTNKEINNLREAIKQLTPTQQKVINLVLEGKTQTEIGKILGKHQTTIHKILFGNITYLYPKNPTHGGIIKKLKKLLTTDENALTQHRKAYKSTQERNKLIYEGYMSGMSLAELAYKNKKAQGTIEEIIRKMKKIYKIL